MRPPRHPLVPLVLVPGLVPALVPALVVALLVLAGCGSSSPATSPSAADHDDADVAFAQGMIPHHAQAVTMAEQAVSRARDPRVRRLAQTIADAQGPEIELMSGWLEAWGEPAPATSAAMADDGRMGMHGMGGMMSADQMSGLDQARGPAYDRLWLRLMVQHHEGAVDAARTEVEQGRDPDAVALAERIVASQTAEVATMRSWLAS